MPNEAAISRFSFNDALVMEGTAERFMSNLQEFMNAKPEDAQRREEAIRAQVEQTYYGRASGPEGPTKPFIFHDGIAVIPVHGVLINRFNSSWGFVTGYNYIRSMLRAALADDDVELIVFDVDSPGGDAPGCFELCDEIRASREVKPSIAVVDAMSASGGYAIGSSCTRMTCIPSGSVGSIGVYWIHADRSGMYAQMGVKYTIYEAPEGGAKTEGNPYGPMSERAAKEAQERVNRRWDEFVALVVANRGISEEEVRATQARLLRADEALALGLIDAVSTPSEAVADFLGELASDEPLDNDDEEISMALPKDQAEMDRMLAAARTEGASAAATEAVTADRKRRKDIMELPEAAKRQKLATHLADSDTSVEAAKGILSAAGEETVSAPQQQQEQQQQQAPQQTNTTQQQAPNQQQQQQQQQQPNHFMQAMDNGGGAGVGHQGGNQPQQQGAKSEEDHIAAILGDQAASGNDRREKQKA